MSPSILFFSSQVKSTYETCHRKTISRRSDRCVNYHNHTNPSYRSLICPSDTYIILLEIWAVNLDLVAAIILVRITWQPAIKKEIFLQFHLPLIARPLRKWKHFCSKPPNELLITARSTEEDINYLTYQSLFGNLTFACSVYISFDWAQHSSRHSLFCCKRTVCLCCGVKAHKDRCASCCFLHWHK